MNNIEIKMLERRLSNKLDEFMTQNEDRIFKNIEFTDEQLDPLMEIIDQKIPDIIEDIVDGVCKLMLESPDSKYMNIQDKRSEVVTLIYNSDLIYHITHKYIEDNKLDCSEKDILLKLFTHYSEKLTLIGETLKNIFKIKDGLASPLDYKPDNKMINNILDLAVGVTIDRPEEPEDKRPKITVYATYALNLLDLK